jgi:hypothetical protein
VIAGRKPPLHHNVIKRVEDGQTYSLISMEGGRRWTDE